jgi:hypothetical protein
MADEIAKEKTIEERINELDKRLTLINKGVKDLQILFTDDLLAILLSARTKIGKAQCLIFIRKQRELIAEMRQHVHLAPLNQLYVDGKGKKK